MPQEAQAYPVAHRCGCGASFDDSRWALLPLVDRVDSDEVQLFVPSWADGHSIEIRQCDECARGVVSKIEVHTATGARRS
jgi:hypothetical protein